MFFKAFCNRDLHVQPRRLLSGHAPRPRCSTKMMRVMKLTFILLFTFCLHLSASSVAQNVTFSGKDVPLQRIFTEIEKQTGNVIFISKQLLRDAKPVTVQAENMPL